MLSCERRETVDPGGLEVPKQAPTTAETRQPVRKKTLLCARSRMPGRAWEGSPRGGRSPASGTMPPMRPSTWSRCRTASDGHGRSRMTLRNRVVDKHCDTRALGYFAGALNRSPKKHNIFSKLDLYVKLETRIPDIPRPCQEITARMDKP
jgi:hypothetical protein